MSMPFRKVRMVLSLLFVAACAWGQATDARNFTFTSQTVVKTNLPKLAPCLFELQGILRERFGQSAIIGGMRASGPSVIELWTDAELEGKAHYILRISARRLSIKGATQEAIQCGLKALDKILREETNHTANRQIAPRRIESVSGSDCP
ncbi:hypothetical protein [Oxalobacter paraformigenes]|uniref:Uncharacterized protein n=1 Tax=Oxalobacter paraformigenes TaxID=556268 RepID=C3X3J3_9BURK|nr:hypothetical protein [Oxalobacter paraformigenes]EEO27779.1 hypothetical protein OFAG_00932 [Oxalobacter paraformigenes]